MYQHPLLKFVTVTAICFFLIPVQLRCQSRYNFSQLNHLPQTKLVSAPEFDTHKKYFFGVDSIHHLLIIQDYRFSAGKAKTHFYQWVYEIPLEDLNINSFIARVCPDDTSSIEISIATTANKTSIIDYMFYDNKAAVIRSRDLLTLGPWPKSQELMNEIKENLKIISSGLKDHQNNTNHRKLVTSSFKYKAENTTTIGQFDTDTRLNNYYFALNFPELREISFAKLDKEIRQKNTAQPSDMRHPVPVMVYFNQSGECESVFSINKDVPYQKNFDLSTLNIGMPLKYKNENIKVKYVYLLSE